MPFFSFFNDTLTSTAHLYICNMLFVNPFFAYSSGLVVPPFEHLHGHGHRNSACWACKSLTFLFAVFVVLFLKINLCSVWPLLIIQTSLSKCIFIDLSPLLQPCFDFFRIFFFFSGPNIFILILYILTLTKQN